MSRHRPTALELLRAHWDKKLEESGFKDIEKPNSWQWHSSYFQARYTPDRFQIQQDYFIMATHFLQTHKFNKRKDFEVWLRHVNGMFPVEISKDLKALGLKASKDTVYRIIDKLEKIMKLGFHL